ncbi:MBL fold metallo-hydrolase [Mammaliicoccus sciuri]|uniref:MBL fold metallo-hydrolase n=1 Tax=Mammaliicoccus sciuri TaxID=1296 RepID=UPI0021CFE9FD|nr:MBL fold metallo-hydrolase [Mammaliicoccus sciuri]UXU85110.1 MBL fold metallo-hydrolase [Mammaliicoccus sciuri]UXU94956.1 MBL fold metallo-hydrolase [Mammaliicoccus sciuri]UXV16902.1 MBL fold metallo-hydrolase [Mammaliicoccus sciuri]UXV25165.1 MBL fold metallo-hydrolase [Mammaliicoccus sciuri]UXV27952.1 MBL fold metallo-hydrolase [Mammaliicoccus sciuri]
MQVHSFSLGIVETNCYILEGENELLVIDPGDNGDFLNKQIKQYHKKVSAVLLTHAHFDHIGAVDDVANEFDVKVYVHPEEKSWLTDTEKNGSKKFEMYQLPQVVQHTVPQIMEPGEYEIGEFNFEAIHTPGHSPGSLSFVFGDFAIVGDTLFKGGIGRTDLYKGDTQTLLNSIEDKLLELDPNTTIFPGHGPETTIADEEMTNPYLNGFN